MSGHPLTSAPEMSSLRHRITFGTSRSLAYVSVLELGTLWERTLRRGLVPLKYSQGFNPRPRMHFAAPLPVGCGSKADLLDLSLNEPRTSDAIIQSLAGVTPPGLTILDVVAVAPRVPALSEQLVEAEYQVWLREANQERLSTAVIRLLQASSVLLPKRGRRHRGKTYDLRPLIKTLGIEPNPKPDWTVLGMQLNARPGATGRPDEVLKALELTEIPRRCFRTRLILDHHLGGR